MSKSDLPNTSMSTEKKNKIARVGEFQEEPISTIYSYSCDKFSKEGDERLQLIEALLRDQRNTVV